jgi:hypothetical protein
MLVLIAFPVRDIDLADEIEERLERAAREQRIRMENVRIVRHLKGALREIESDAVFSHCIVHDDLPRDAQSSPAPGGGFALAQALRQRGSPLPLTLFHARSTWPDADIETLAELTLKPARNSEQGMRDLIDRVLGSPAAGERIDITLDLSRIPHECTYDISCTGLPPSVRSGTLKVSQHALTTAQRLSNSLEKDDHWQDVLRDLGGHLLQSLIEQQDVFSTTLKIVLNPNDADERSRLLFRLHPQQYEVAFEAIRHPGKELPWMLRAPVIRSLSDCSESPAHPILRDGELRPHNCLLLVSSAAGHCAIRDAEGEIVDHTEYVPLGAANDECDELDSLLRKAREAGKAIGDVRVIGRKEPMTAAAMKSALAERTWDVVHYIGHTDYVADRGYFITVGPEGEAEALGIEEIAPHLQDSRFVYFSSCQGTKLAFVRRLAQHGVPTVLGFRVKVQDQLALEHAACFYENLLNRNSIEQAFHRTRLHFHEKYPRERLWACSSLIMQRA